MDRLSLMETFVRVAELGSFSRAADRLGLSRSVVSKYLSALEDHLGARLVNRTTRRLSLTEVGEAYLDRCQRILADLEEAEQAVGSLHGEPRGTLRINAPMSFGFLHLAPALPRFLEAHPGLSVDVTLNDRFVDLLEEGFDLGVRIGSLSDSSLIARKIAPLHLVLCASPEYLARRGMPATLDDLAEHDHLSYSLSRGGDVWTLEGANGETVAVPVRPHVRINNGDALMAAALGGAGILYSPTFICHEALRAGRLVRVLPDWGRQAGAIHVVYPHSRHLSAKVRVFADFLKAHCGTTPYWDEGL